MKKTIHFLLILVAMIYTKPSESQIRIGVFADVQYADSPASGTRYYKNSLFKLNECIEILNRVKGLSFVAGLGDLIDHDFSSFDSVNVLLEKSKYPVYHVIGNHDLAVDKKNIGKVYQKLNLRKRYYSKNEENWKFVFLNGSEIFYDSPRFLVNRKAKDFVKILTNKGQPNNKEWNGGISKKQLRWFGRELKKALKNKQKVAVFCHYPILPLEAHTLWNSDEVLEIMKKYNCVKVCLSGHNHAGNYTFQQGIHFVNLHGMVETEKENAFAIITFLDDRIDFDSFGREQNRNLYIY